MLKKTFSNLQTRAAKYRVVRRNGDYRERKREKEREVKLMYLVERMFNPCIKGVESLQRFIHEGDECTSVATGRRR